MVVEFFFHDQIFTKECARREDGTHNRLIAGPYAHATEPQRHLKAWNKWGVSNSPPKHLQIGII